MRIVKRAKKNNFSQSDSTLMPSLIFVNEADQADESRKLSDLDASFIPVLEISKIASDNVTPTDNTKQIS